ncbi:ABC transporter permease [Tessaracoccus sp. MC1627]|uniref:ABC transporter permease n=1 Tax=Tessaracoccus sp. MC1627 TaxID=2760312 RepID=UPI0015FEDD39|nr:ABC transporter permease [Tessaracoccus sp. MC1627]MBB1513241.1 ABC transporter permease [Tessaracoccus sp. MC1627]MBB1513426.1 ABC transporter permease [Tessaracoccus sp. MC1627]
MSDTTVEAKPKFNATAAIKKYAILLILIGFMVILAIVTGGTFLRSQNLINVVVQVAPIGIVALGMMFAIITKGIDLSVGSTVALVAVVSASLAQVQSDTAMFPGLPPMPIFVSIIVGLLVGAIVGAIVGTLVAYFRIPPFVATLGMMTAARGLANIYTGGRPVSNLADGFNWLGQGAILGIPVPMIIFLLVAVVIWVVLNRTRFGRHTYAIGGNEQAARVSGISIGKVQFLIYTLIGLLAGLAGMILAARIGSGQPTLGVMLELDAITAAVIGGVSFNGGIGVVWGVVVGALIIGVINNGLDLMNVSPFMQMVVKGAIIVIAVIIDERKNR